jgi:hypothetical protein
LRNRFEDLYFLLCKKEWIEAALQRVLSNDGAVTPGVDGLSWRHLHDMHKSDFENEQFRAQFITQVQADLKGHTFRPLPVQRVEIPKPGTDKKRPLGIPIPRSHYTSFQHRLGSARGERPTDRPPGIVAGCSACDLLPPVVPPLAYRFAECTEHVRRQRDPV